MQPAGYFVEFPEGGAPRCGNGEGRRAGWVAVQVQAPLRAGRVLGRGERAAGGHGAEGAEGEDGGVVGVAGRWTAASQVLGDGEENCKYRTTLSQEVLGDSLTK